MLGLGPDGHLGGAGGDEDERRERPGGGREQNPAVYLKSVVGAGDVIESEAVRDRVALAARRAQVALDHMRPAQEALPFIPYCLEINALTAFDECSGIQPLMRARPRMTVSRMPPSLHALTMMLQMHTFSPC